MAIMLEDFLANNVGAFASSNLSPSNLLALGIILIAVVRYGNRTASEIASVKIAADEFPIVKERVDKLNSNFVEVEHELRLNGSRSLRATEPVIYRDQGIREIMIHLIEHGPNNCVLHGDSLNAIGAVATAETQTIESVERLLQAVNYLSARVGRLENELESRSEDGS